ncbi:multiple epidermal growth factor-like domains protein 10 isoform X1 [Saccostrea cucullata]|uniref:multiple epidermal growth factor-like domains protein 10 isoform X1 n=1 Tax=Saccostrea cuccullata TaxID=36930 RepID=UPI002ED415ED
MTSSSCRKQSGLPCCYNQYLDQNSNICIECPVGSFGWNCHQRCPSGYYGLLCRSACECPASDCHNVTGCIREKRTSFPSLSTGTTYKTIKISEWTHIAGNLQNTTTPRPFPAKQHVQNKNINHHDDTWIALSSLLIGTMVTIILIGCFLYFRSR